MDTKRLADLLRGAKDDYAQLADAYPNAQGFATSVLKKLDDNMGPSDEAYRQALKDRNPKGMIDWAIHDINLTNAVMPPPTKKLR